jgi:Protein of unknown function (DUF3306)
MAERDDDNFLSRWSRRKVAVKQGAAVVPEPPVVAPEPALPVRAEASKPLASPSFDTSGQSEQPPQGEREAAPPALTLDDVSQLTKESDFSRFVAPGVDPGVKNAAMKKLFASDPHFNVMDGLDTYIDDYNKFEPIPKSMLRQLVSARALGLIDDELEEQPKPDNPPTHEDAVVQLQPDDATGQRVADEGARPDDTGGDPHDAVPPRSA